MDRIKTSCLTKLSQHLQIRNFMKRWLQLYSKTKLYQLKKSIFHKNGTDTQKFRTSMVKMKEIFNGERTCFLIKQFVSDDEHNILGKLS